MSPRPSRTPLAKWIVLAALAASCGSPAAPSRAADGAVASAPIGGLRRRAVWGVSAEAETGAPGVKVRRVRPDTAAARAGVKAGDRILKVNGRDVADASAFGAASRALRGGDTVTLAIAAASAAPRELRFRVDPMPLETLAGAKVDYESVVSPRGARLRTIVTRPEPAPAERLPAVLFIPWLSCDSVEPPATTKDGMSLTLRRIATQSGMVLMRIERPGLGDSEGPDCSDATLEDDMAGFHAALRALRERAGVDPSRLFIVGGSIGGGLAPILARDAPVRGVVSMSGFAKTWYEHMLEIERRRLALEGRTPAEVNDAMRGLAVLYAEYLIAGKTPEQVLRARPELAPLWNDEPARQYGRPAAYYQEVQRLNVEGAWAALDAPALIVWGEYDWIMSRDDQDRAAAIVNARHPGAATLLVLPKTGHDLNVFPSLKASFDGADPGFDEAVARAIVDWLKAHA